MIQRIKNWFSNYREKRRRKQTLEIIIVYGFWNYYDEWDYNETYVTIEELSNFKPNDY